ncbi:copper amine oxidase N-terminal domain-containing protein [Paenibacillus daejeonensis]|uniref:copper amine oxidase N-terminal domain-containing protein n=1 Tax=Paenibacillus daejeonensis TaxID=135193 RepID=UPI0003610869|nr:copper amine oxidase N-terminal domain-containing protein [Paenibacillus daejeonensis]
MKRNVKKGLTSLLSVSVLSLSAASIISASPANVVPISAPISAPAQQDVVPISAPIQDEVAPYAAVTGVVTQIQDHGADGELKMLTLELEGGEIANPVITKDTYFIDDVEPAVGQKLVIFYDTGKPMLMIYPPQYTAEVVAEVSDDINYKVDRFDENLLSADGNLILNVSDETDITFADGTPFEGELSDYVLVVSYTITTRSLPPQTPPVKIVALEDDPGLPVYGDPELPESEDLDTDEPVVPISDIIGNVGEKDLVVNDLIIDAPAAYLSDEDHVMVPLRAIVEALDLELKWVAAEKGIIIDEDITLAIGKDLYANADNDAIDLGAAPSLVEGNTYVPLAFFKDVVGLNNAYVFESQIVIDNNEPIE